MVEVTDWTLSHHCLPGGCPQLSRGPEPAHRERAWLPDLSSSRVSQNSLLKELAVALDPDIMQDLGVLETFENPQVGRELA